MRRQRLDDWLARADAVLADYARHRATIEVFAHSPVPRTSE